MQPVRAQTEETPASWAKAVPNPEEVSKSFQTKDLMVCIRGILVIRKRRSMKRRRADQQVRGGDKSNDCNELRDIGRGVSHYVTRVASCNRNGSAKERSSVTGVQAVFLQLAVQGSAVETQGLSRLGHVVGRDLQRVDQRLPLDFCRRENRRQPRRVSPGSHDRREPRREAVQLQYVRRLPQNSVLDGVLQLAHVAGPVVLRQQGSVAFCDKSRILRQGR